MCVLFVCARVYFVCLCVFCLFVCVCFVRARVCVCACVFDTGKENIHRISAAQEFPTWWINIRFVNSRQIRVCIRSLINVKCWRHLTTRQQTISQSGLSLGTDNRDDSSTCVCVCVYSPLHANTRSSDFLNLVDLHPPKEAHAVKHLYKVTANPHFFPPPHIFYP